MARTTPWVVFLGAVLVHILVFVPVILAQGFSGGWCPYDDGCSIYEGKIAYSVIGNSMSYAEDRTNCNQKASSSANLEIPDGAKVHIAFLQWSGSGFPDYDVTLNGNYVSYDNIYTHTIYSWSFFGAHADVTTLVTNKGTYEVADLSWSSDYDYCQANAAYGAWSLVVVYDDPSAASDSRIHVCQDKFVFTYPDNYYFTSIGCVGLQEGCPGDQELTIVTFESDAYKGEYFYIEDSFIGDNIFDGSTAPNLDIERFDMNMFINGSTSELTYYFMTYLTNTVWGPAIEGMFDFVKVLKYPFSCSLNAGPTVQCFDASVCVGQMISTDMIYDGSNGLFGHLWLDWTGPFDTIGQEIVTLTLTERDGRYTTCGATITVYDCESPAPTPQSHTPHPTESLTPQPTEIRTSEPTGSPTLQPTEFTTPHPTESPTQQPTEFTTPHPTELPTSHPTQSKTSEPTESPTLQPTESHTPQPTELPTQQPTEAATWAEVNTHQPTQAPTMQATESPTKSLTTAPSESRTPKPTKPSTVNPTASQTETPTSEPTKNPTTKPLSQKAPVAICTDFVTVCIYESVTAEQIGLKSYDTDGTILRFELNNSGPFNQVGEENVTLTVTDNDGLTDQCETTIIVENCVKNDECTTDVVNFELIDALDDKSLGLLTDTIDYTAYERDSFNIKATVKECPGGVAARSVLFNFENKNFCDSTGAFALLGDSSTQKNYLGRSFFLRDSPYQVVATPFNNSLCSGSPSGANLTQNFNVMGPRGFNGCPGAPVYFELYNAETAERISVIRNRAQICKPDYNVTIRANVIDCERSRVRSVGFELIAGQPDVTTDLVDEDGPQFFLYGDLDNGSLAGRPAILGKNRLKATTYSGDNLQGDVGTSLSIFFYFVDCMGNTARRLRRSTS